MSRLLDNSKAFRDQLIAKNTFTNNDEYVVGNSHALSDGDEHGKGEKQGQVGNATDVAKKDQLIAKNRYGKDKEYSSALA